jgi:hypothetical protein
MPQAGVPLGWVEPTRLPCRYCLTLCLDRVAVVADAAAVGVGPAVTTPRQWDDVVFLGGSASASVVAQVAERVALEDLSALSALKAG